MCKFLSKGGHTAEMLNVINFLDKQRFYPRVYIAALTDNMSLSRAATMEERVGTSSALHKGNVRYIQIYRSREVGQSYITSILTTIIATFHGLWLVFSVRPDIERVNLERSDVEGEDADGDEAEAMACVEGEGSNAGLPPYETGLFNLKGR
ncbi:hypothetical protein L7F22_044999 [Adiantum nelumboides]|nr:hypothetical protein [Adiantum nelumboides]